MSKKNSLMEYVDDFIKNGEIRSNATLKGDYKVNNKAYKCMDKILNIAKNNKNAEKFYLEILNRSTDITAITTCCVNMLKLNIKPQMAREKLKEIIDNDAYPPLLCFNAEMFLKEWDKGNIKPIIKDQISKSNISVRIIYKTKTL